MITVYKDSHVLVENSVHDLWTLRDFRNRYHAEIPEPTLSTLRDDMVKLNAFYITLALLYKTEFPDGPLKIKVV